MRHAGAAPCSGLLALDGALGAALAFFEIEDGEVFLILVADDVDVFVGEQVAFGALEVGDGDLVFGGGADEILLGARAATALRSAVAELGVVRRFRALAPN